jgi:pimeloyl-ACP methyl ester carboxylesterase
MSKLNQQFQLPSGYRLGYDEHGPTNGEALFYFHGSPSSRLEFNLFGTDALLQSLNAHLIAVDRPGMGLSDFQPGRSLLDWPRDVLALADGLNLESFSVLAYSLGGPYGMACAYAISERLTKVGIVSGAAIFTHSELMQNINKGTRRYLNLPRENPLAAKIFLWMMVVMARFAPRLMIANATSLLPQPDRRVVSDPEIQKGFIAMVREALRQGTRGPFHESLLAITEWGFRLQDVQRPVLLWHGEADQNIPVDMARYAASNVPQCKAEFFSNEGHLSLFKNNVGDIIRALVE